MLSSLLLENLIGMMKGDVQLFVMRLIREESSRNHFWLSTLIVVRGSHHEDKVDFDRGGVDTNPISYDLSII